MFFVKDILTVKKYKQKHLSNNQPDISKEKRHKQKHLSNIHPDISKQKST